ncbi:hypothetical protein FRB99_005836, partial [Tulasnella sp. 403]
EHISHFVVQDSRPFEPSFIALDEYSTSPEVFQRVLKAAKCTVPELIPYPSSLRDLLVPPLLSSRGDIEFILHPPSPFHEPLGKLFAAYNRCYNKLQSLVSLLDLFFRSHGIPATEFTSTCLTIMMIYYLQAQYNLLDLQSPASLVRNSIRDRVYWPEDPRWEELGRQLAQYNLGFGERIRFAGQEELKNIPCGEILSGFFRFWIDIFNPDDDVVFIGWNLKESPGYWRSAVLVVQDPFLLTHNHTQNVSRKTWQIFRGACRRAVQQLEERAPLHTIFGDDTKALPLPPPQTRASQPEVSKWINDIFVSETPPPRVMAAREKTIRLVSEAIRNAFGPTYAVECFGSTRYGVDSSTSDLDMVILDANRPNGFHPSVNLKKLPGRVLLAAGFSNMTAIPRASVPIVKFSDPKSNIQIDLNCNDQLGFVNTVLLHNYCEMWPGLRPMIFFLKRWAKSWGLNDPSGANGPSSFSSYCLALMAVALLQLKGHLPTLQKCATGPVDQGVSGFWLRLKGSNKRLWCDTRFEAPATPNSVNLDLKDAIYEWFRFFGYEFDYETYIINIKYGRLISRHQMFSQRNRQTSGGPPLADKAGDAVEAMSLTLGAVELSEGEGSDKEAGEDVDQVGAEEQPKDWARSRLVVVDPFIVSKNVACTASVKVQERFQQECQRAASMMDLGYPINQLLGDNTPLFNGPAGQKKVRPKVIVKEKGKQKASTTGAGATQPQSPHRATRYSRENRQKRLATCVVH